MVADHQGVEVSEVDLGDKTLEQLKSEAMDRVRTSMDNVAESFNEAKKSVTREDRGSDYEEALAYAVHQSKYTQQSREKKLEEIKKILDVGVDGLAEFNHLEGPAGKLLAKMIQLKKAKSPEQIKKLEKEKAELAKQVQAESKKRMPDRYKGLTLQKIYETVDNGTEAVIAKDEFTANNPWKDKKVKQLLKEVKELSNRQRSAIWEFKQLSTATGKINFLKDLDTFKEEIGKAYKNQELLLIKKAQSHLD